MALNLLTDILELFAFKIVLVLANVLRFKLLMNEALFSVININVVIT